MIAQEKSAAGKAAHKATREARTSSQSLSQGAGAVKKRFSHWGFTRALVAFPWPKRKRLSCIAVGTALAAHAGVGKGDSCFPNTRTLADEAGVCERTVIAARLMLREAGFLSWRAQGREHRYQYLLTIPELGDSRGAMETARRGATKHAREARRGATGAVSRCNGDSASRCNENSVKGTGEMEQGEGERAGAREDTPPLFSDSTEDQEQEQKPDLSGKAQDPEDWIEEVAQRLIHDRTVRAVPSAEGELSGHLRALLEKGLTRAEIEGAVSRVSGGAYWPSQWREKIEASLSEAQARAPQNVGRCQVHGTRKMPPEESRAALREFRSRAGVNRLSELVGRTAAEKQRLEETPKPEAACVVA